MRKSLKHKINNLEQAVDLFWKLQRQWNNSPVANTHYTVSDANNILRQIIHNMRFPKQLRKQASEFQAEIISPKTRRATLKTYDALKVVVQLTR